MAEEQKTSDLDELMKLQSAAPFDDDYQVKSVNRDNAQNLDWFESKNRELGIQMPEVVVGGEADPAKPAEGAAPAEAQPTTFAGQVWDKTKAVGTDLAGIPSNAANIVVGGPMKAVEGVAGLTGAVSDWIEKNIVSFGGLQILDKDGNFDPQVLGPENWEKFKETVGDKNAERWHDMFNVANVMDTPKDSYSAQMLQAMTQFLTGFGAVGRAAPALKLSSAPATSWAQAGTEAAKLMTRSSITDFAAFDGHEGNLANLVESFPTLQNPVTEFLATNEETPELVGRLQNTVANIPFNVPFGVFLSGLRSIREARKVKVQTGAETYAEAAEKLAKGGVDVGEGAAPPPVGNKIHEILGDPNDDIVKFVEPYVQQTADAEAVGARFAPEPKTPDQTFGDYLSGLKEAFSDPNAPKHQSIEERSAVNMYGKLPHELTPEQKLKVDEAVSVTKEQEARSATITEGDGLPPRPPGEPPVAAGGPDKGPFSRQVNINWARIDTNDDVKSLIGQMADMYAPEIQAKQRGVRTNAQTIKAAGDQEAWKVLIGERKGNLPTAEEQLALRQLWASSGEKLAETAKLATSGDSESMFAFRRMLTVHNMIQQEVIGVRTETARALQQWRIPAGGNKEMLDQLNFAIQSHGGENVTRALAERIAILADRPEWQGALDQMVRKSGFAKTMDSVRELWINAILSGPKTHIVNLMSNSAVVAQSVMERAVAGRLGHVLDPVEGVRIGEATAMWWGMRQSMRDALAYSWQALKTGNTGYGRSQLEGPRVRALSAESWGTQNAVLGKGLDMMGSVVNVPGRMLQASDEFFKTINYRAELWAQAFRQASSEVDAGVIKANELKGRIADIVSDPPENIRLKAADMAAYNTFTNEPGNISKALMRVRTSLDESSRVPLGTMILPFINTPGNLMKFTFERTPLAPLMAKVRADIAAGGARRDLALARVGMGSILTTVAFDLAMDGTVTSSGPSGDKGSAERQALTRGGWQPYSIKVRTGGTDANPTYRWYAYNRLDPVGGQLAMAAELAELLRNSDGKADPSWEEAAAAVVLGASQTYMNKSYFSGMSNLVAALQNPDRYGESYFTKLASSFVPTGVAEVAKFNDPVQRSTWDMLSKIKARTPGLSKDLPPRLDFWGRPMEYDSGLGATYDAVSPIYSKTNTKAEPIDREFFALHYFPTHPGTISLSGRSISLRNNPDIKNRMIELTSATKASQLVDENYDDLAEAKKKASAGRLMGYGDDTMLETLNKMVDGSHPTLSVEYKAADDDDKVKLIQDVIKTYRDAAKVQVIRENPDLKERRDALPSREDLSEEAPF